MSKSESFLGTLFETLGMAEIMHSTPSGETITAEFVISWLAAIDLWQAIPDVNGDVWKPLTIVHRTSTMKTGIVSSERRPKGGK